MHNCCLSPKSSFPTKSLIDHEEYMGDLELFDEMTVN